MDQELPNFGAPDFTPCFSWSLVNRFLVLGEVLLHALTFFLFSVGHWIVCTLIYGFDYSFGIFKLFLSVTLPSSARVEANNTNTVTVLNVAMITEELSYLLKG